MHITTICRHGCVSMNAPGNMIHLSLIGVVLLIVMLPIAPVRADYTLTVNFINYTNPSGLCAECNTRLTTPESLAQIVPVCCDESPFKTDNCNNTGEARCDTRFRWALRMFDASLETRPPTERNAENPPYKFNPCYDSSAMCPFSEMNRTFGQDFLGRENPFPFNSSDEWLGRIQFFVESLDTNVSYIIDSFLINLDNLQLGADFTEEMIFTGYHNISYMTMSFKVECAPNYCGVNCQTTTLNNPPVSSCANNGDVVCNVDRLDPSTGCTTCLHNLNFSTDCSTCLDPNFDPDTNCSSCLTGFDRSTNCLTCLPNYDPTTNCSTCFDRKYDPVKNCSACINTKYDPMNNCSTCINTNFNSFDSCTSCVQDGFDPTTNCSMCLPNRQLSTNCTQCLPGWDIDSDCMSCLLGRDPDSEPGCTECLPGRDLSTSCTTCLSGYAGEDCLLETDPPPTTNVALVSGIAGGVGGFLLFVIIILVTVVLVLTCQMRRGRFNVSDQKASNNVYNLNGRAVGSGSSVEHQFQNPIYGPGMDPELSQTKTRTGSSDEHMSSNILYESARLQRQDDYAHLRHPSVSPPAHVHLVKTGTNEFSSPNPSQTPVYDSANYVDEKQPPAATESSPVYDSTEEKPSPSNPLKPREQRGYSRLRQPIEVTPLAPLVPNSSSGYSSANFTDPVAQPVYDVADLPPTLDKSPQQALIHPTKSGAAYEDIDDELNLSGGGKVVGGLYDVANYPPPVPDSNVPSAHAYAELEGPAEVNVNVPIYAVANNGHPSSVKQQPVDTAVYDTADFPYEPAPAPLVYDYADTPSKDLPPELAGSTKRNPYDYIDTPLKGSANTLPVQAPLVKPGQVVYSNTLPGEITPEAEGHYDFGL